MGQSFKITREELSSFAKKLYQEACYGYMDLCDSVVETMIADFLDGRKPMDTGILANLVNTPVSFNSSLGLSPPPRSSPPPIPGQNPYIPTRESDLAAFDFSIVPSGVTIVNTDLTINSDTLPFTPDMATAFENDQIIMAEFGPRAATHVREEVVVRPNTDFVGNISEML
jgi:hypothetical protein